MAVGEHTLAALPILRVDFEGRIKVQETPMEPEDVLALIRARAIQDRARRPALLSPSKPA
jgi:hypothetical protein